MKLRRPSGLSGPFIASVAIHLVVITLFVQAIVFKHPLFDLFGHSKHETVPPIERIGFLALPPSPSSASPVSGRSGGNGRPVHAPEQRLIAPATVPKSIPVSTLSKGATGDDLEPATGPLIGGGGPLRGIQPRYTSPLVWGEPSRIATAPKTAVERLDSVITNDIGAHNDSVRLVAGSGRAPGDWTVDHNGKKYGVDSKFIRLGPVSIPTAVLAMLPLNITGNPTTYQREKTLTSRHDEIFEQAQRGINDADFSKAVRSIRERKERERREADDAKQKAASSAASGSN